MLANSAAPGDALPRRIKAVERRWKRQAAQVLCRCQVDVSATSKTCAALSHRGRGAGIGPGATAIIHAAGVIEDGLIQTKTMTEIEDVFAPKTAWHAGDRPEVWPDGDLDWMVLFSSSSTATAPVQVRSITWLPTNI